MLTKDGYKNYFRIALGDPGPILKGIFGLLSEVCFVVSVDPVEMPSPPARSARSAQVPLQELAKQTMIEGSTEVCLSPASGE